MSLLNFSVIVSEDLNSEKNLEETDSEQAFFVSECLMMAGALSVSFEDAEDIEDSRLIEPDPNTTPLWKKTKVIACFDDKNFSETDKNHIQKNILEFLAGFLPDEILKTAKIEILEEQDWEGLIFKSLEPMRFGKRVWVCPSGQELPSDSTNTSNNKESSHSNETAIRILLDPGLAFGTGHHETTRLCLECLEAASPLQGEILDYGCGSGILSIAALKLGATFAYAVDHDPQALISTKENAKRNGFSEKKFQCFLPEDLNLNHKVDWIVSNILAKPLIELAFSFSQKIKTGGHIILSGILDSQEKELLSAYEPYFQDFKIHKLSNWIALTAIRK